ncbi:hypothetical protein [Metamycoplasma hominis]|uniref:hypothetical protein n=1 Tax=Metamycoplasma hominis TaxID=2098 RepID=UPI001E620C7B|nr:hypothetical protein [Metamycoplasma hominis]
MELLEIWVFNLYEANQFLNVGDEYCLISPIKYWKWKDIKSFNFVEGFYQIEKIQRYWRGFL